jgi:hypothetical protein
VFSRSSDCGRVCLKIVSQHPLASIDNIRNCILQKEWVHFNLSPARYLRPKWLKNKTRPTWRTGFHFGVFPVKHKTGSERRFFNTQQTRRKAMPPRKRPAEDDGSDLARATTPPPLPPPPLPLGGAVHINNDFCGTCGFGGELLCCERCPMAFHFICWFEKKK